MKPKDVCHVDTTFFHHELNTKHFPYEVNRYWLFSSKLCPFAHRVEITRKLLKLTEDIGLTIAASVQTEKGWNLSERYKSGDSAPNPVEKIGRIPAIYNLSDPGYTGRSSVPVLFDRKTNSIVNNESAEIIMQLDDVAVRHYNHPSLYPYKIRKSIDSLVNTFTKEFVTSIYRAGFAKDQQTYDLNFRQVFNYLEKLDNHLSDVGPYIAGDELTIADVHAFPHLSRFDSVFHSLYRLNLKFLCEFSNIKQYMSCLGELSAFADTLNIRETKKGYFLSWNQPTNGYFIPEGPMVDLSTGIATLA